MNARSLVRAQHKQTREREKKGSTNAHTHHWMCYIVTNVDRKDWKKANNNNASIIRQNESIALTLWNRWNKTKKERKKSTRTNKIHTCVAFCIGIYSSYTVAKSESKSESESSLCIKIDGITFDCVPLTQAPAHTIYWSSNRANKSDTAKERDRDSVSEVSGLTCAFCFVCAHTMGIGIDDGKSNVIWDFNKLLLPRVMSVLLMSNCQIKITRK